jgi:hypothetical protein
MTDKNTPSSIPAAIRAVLDLHVGKNHPEVPTSIKLELLEKRVKRYRIMILVNLFALMFFSYSFISGITQIGDLVYYGLGVVFVLNMALIIYQRKQVMLTINYLKEQS